MGLLDKIFNKNKTEKEDSVRLFESVSDYIYVNDSFSYFGNGKCGRPLEELNKINIQEADKAFKKCKKELLDAFMKNNGFIKYKTNAYMRFNSIGLIEYINLQKEAHGSRTFTLNVCVLPIYVPHDVFTIGFGDRIGILINGKDFWWDYKDLCTSERSFENVIQALNLFIFPWFNQYNSEDKYQKDLFDEVGIIGHSRIKWITYLYIKNNEIEKAKDYLNEYLNSDAFNNEIEIRKNNISQIITDLMKLLHSSKTNVDILNEAIIYNVDKYKLSKTLTKKIMVQLKEL